MGEELHRHGPYQLMAHLVVILEQVVEEAVQELVVPVLLQEEP